MNSWNSNNDNNAIDAQHSFQHCMQKDWYKHHFELDNRWLLFSDKLEYN